MAARVDVAMRFPAPVPKQDNRSSGEGLRAADGPEALFWAASAALASVTVRVLCLVRVITYNPEALLDAVPRIMFERSSQGERLDWPENGGAQATEPPERALSREEAQALRRRQPSISPWRVVAVQAVIGLLCALGAWALGDRAAVWSALYGAAATVLPNALMARGMTRRALNPAAAAAGFMFWEMLKIGVAIAMLVIAARVVPQLSWPVLLVTMVVCMKVNWFALLWRGR